MQLLRGCLTIYLVHTITLGDTIISIVRSWGCPPTKDLTRPLGDRQKFFFNDTLGCLAHAVICVFVANGRQPNLCK